MRSLCSANCCRRFYVPLRLLTPVYGQKRNDGEEKSLQNHCYHSRVGTGSHREARLPLYVKRDSLCSYAHAFQWSRGTGPSLLCLIRLGPSIYAIFATVDAARPSRRQRNGGDQPAKRGKPARTVVRLKSVPRCK